MIRLTLAAAILAASMGAALAQASPFDERFPAAAQAARGAKASPDAAAQRERENAATLIRAGGYNCPLARSVAWQGPDHYGQGMIVRCDTGPRILEFYVSLGNGPPIISPR